MNSGLPRTPFMEEYLHGHRFIDLTGQQFGRLTAEEYSSTNERRKCLWSCVCVCGNHVVVAGVDLRSGNTQSCGCLARDRAAAMGRASATHGQSRKGHKTAEYAAWESIISRTENPNNHAYNNYGGRGIRMCKRWRTSFENFFADMGQRPGSSYTIHRVRNNEGYKKSNCMWVTWHEQARNRRNTKLTQAKVTEIRSRHAAGGITQKVLAMEYGVTPSHISNIIRGEQWADILPPKKPSASVPAYNSSAAPIRRKQNE